MHIRRMNDLDFIKAQQTSETMVKLVSSGHSCKDCGNRDCPFEDHNPPVISGVPICHKWKD